MRVTVVCAISLDGKLANASRGPVRFPSARDRARLHALRDTADALIVGASTIRAEDPPLLPTEARSKERVARGKRSFPVRAVFSRTLDLPIGRALARVDGAPLYVFTEGVPDAGKKARLEQAGVRVCIASTREALEVLAREEQVERVLCEGGGVLNASLLEADVVDEMELTLCPVVLGGTGAPTLVDGPGLAELKRAKLVAHEVTPEGEVFLRYSFRVSSS
jgi:5-amino-6-(5-phosphoribosylamino)uracil reductase